MGESISSWLVETWADRTKRLVLIAALASVIFLTVALLYGGDSSEDSLCAQNNYPGQCYHVPRAACDSSLKIFHRECVNQVADLVLGPSRLPGPIVQMCEQWKFEKSFHYMRVESAFCDQKIKEVEDWHKSNDQF